MDKGRIKDKLKEYLMRLNEFQNSDLRNDRFNLEQNTTIKFAIPLLNILGWNQLTSDMEFEYPIHGKEVQNKIRCDIALYTDKFKKPEVLVEIKRIQEKKLSSGRYLLRYLGATGIDFGIYTNGKELKLVDRRTPAKYRPEGLFSLKAEDFLDYQDVLWMLSKEMVSQGYLKRFAHAYHEEPNFFHWLKRFQTKVKEIDKYILRLEFAKEFLKNR